MPLVRDILNSFVRILIIVGLASFRTFGPMPSGPYALFVSRHLSASSTYFSVMVIMSRMFAAGSCSAKTGFSGWSGND